MIYTCYEMVRDCRADLPEGWVHFILHYVPVCRKVLAHYAPERAGDAALLDRILLTVRDPDSFLFHAAGPPEERWFVSQLRQLIVAGLAAPAAEIPLGLETLTAALEPLTMTEKQAAWLETMRYSPEQAGPMLRVSPDTVEKVRHRAAAHAAGRERSVAGPRGGCRVGRGLPAHQGVPGRGGRAHYLARPRNDGPAPRCLLALRRPFLPHVGSGAPDARQPAPPGGGEPAVS